MDPIVKMLIDTYGLSPEMAQTYAKGMVDQKKNDAYAKAKEAFMTATAQFALAHPAHAKLTPEQEQAVRRDYILSGQKQRDIEQAQRRSKLMGERTIADQVRERDAMMNEIQMPPDNSPRERYGMQVLEGMAQPNAVRISPYGEEMDAPVNGMAKPLPSNMIDGGNLTLDPVPTRMDLGPMNLYDKGAARQEQDRRILEMLIREPKYVDIGDPEVKSLGPPGPSKADIRRWMYMNYATTKGGVKEAVRFDPGPSTKYPAEPTDHFQLNIDGRYKR